MKTLIVSWEREYAWLRRYFPSQHPLLTPVCNKPLLEYLVDFAILCGSREIRVALDGAYEPVMTHFSADGRWGAHIDFVPIHDTDDLAQVCRKNSRFISGTRLLVLSGFFFPYYDKEDAYAPAFGAVSHGELAACETGRIHIQGGTARPGSVSPPPSAPLLAAVALKSVADLYRLSLSILGTYAERYVLPGYNNETDVYMGTNVMTALSAKIIKPVMIGNNVQIRHRAVVGPNAVIGNDVIVDSDCHVRHSVVHDGTYVGAHLELTEKIASRDLLVAPDDESVVQMEDAHLLSGLPAGGPVKGGLQWLSHGLYALILLSILAVPYACLSFILKRQGRWKRETVAYHAGGRRPGRTLRLTAITIDRSSLAGKVARALSLDRFPLLGKVIRGTVHLIGWRPVPIDDKAPESDFDTIAYQPGVFSYAEAEAAVLDMAPEISERFHTAHRSNLRDIRMIGKAMVNRSFKESVT